MVSNIFNIIVIHILKRIRGKLHIKNTFDSLQ